MKLTKNQQKELDILLWFADYSKDIQEEDIKRYFDLSDKGIGKEDGKRALLKPKEYPSGFVKLLVAKSHRDLQISEWKEDWGGAVNAWTFINEPQVVAEWIAKVLDREAIIMEWHKNEANRHRRIAYKYQKIIAGKPYNKPMVLSRS